MKRLFLILLSSVLLSNAYAQYATPGNNLVLTPADLVAMSGGVVTNIGGTYFINNTLTISATDKLKISNPTVIRVAQNIRIEVNGTILSDPIQGNVIWTAQDTSTPAANFRGFRFENSPGNVFRNTVVSYGGGIQLINSGALFEYCTFRRNGSSNVSGAITYSSCNPVIRYCLFEENARSAINSGANVTGSPKIIGNVMIRNTTDNSNRPQINIGPGAADTIYIEGNYIEGFYTMAGGIGISNLLGSGSAKVVVRNNFVVNNRYGYAQIGNNISSLIEDNYFLDNNIQGLPASGGSGVNFQANGAGNTAIVRRNVISGNLWGITIQGTANPILGTLSAPGGNVIFDNSNDGQTYALYNNTALPVQAIGNYWGTNDLAQAEQFIFHQPDQASLGLVTYLPLMEIHPMIETFAFLQADNPALMMDYFGEIDHNAGTITVNLSQNAPAVLIPQINLPFGVVTNPTAGEPIDFSVPVIFQAITPHGETKEYVVYVNFTPGTFTVTFNVLDVTGQPIPDAVLTFNGITFAPGVYVVTDLMPGTYNYSISRNGYFTTGGTVEVIDNNVEVNVVLQPVTADVTFVVFDSNGPVEAALIQVSGQPEKVTNQAGMAVYEALPFGNYSYSVSKPNYFTVEGNFEVTASFPFFIQVPLVLTGIDEHEAKLVLFPNPAKKTFCISGVPSPVRRLIVRDTGGKLVMQTTSAIKDNCFSLSGLANGVYLLHLQTDHNTYVRPLVVH